MAKHRIADRQLTDLEAIVIAFVHRRQPCTPYKIRQSFVKSTTTKFSSSAGSIYPLVKRLTHRGYLVANETVSDGRKTCTYRTSTKGIRKVRSWLANLEHPSQIGIYDPIRSRVTNLSLLPKDQQLPWLQHMITLLEQQHELIQLFETQPFVGDHRLYEVVRQSLWAENQLRIQWLSELRDILKGAQNVA